jgi:hypothetical protein
MDRNQREVASAHVNLVEAARYEHMQELLKDRGREMKRDIEWEFAQAQNEFRKERRKASIYLDGIAGRLSDSANPSSAGAIGSTVLNVPAGGIAKYLPAACYPQ